MDISDSRYAEVAGYALYIPRPRYNILNAESKGLPKLSYMGTIKTSIVDEIRSTMIDQYINCQNPELLACDQIR